MELSGKVSLITGGSRGVGKAIGLTFAQQGSDVALVYKSSKDEAEQTASNIRKTGRNAIAIPADLKDPKQAAMVVEKTVKELGGLDILSHSAGAQVQWNTIRDSDPAQWADYVTNDLIGSYNIFQPVLRYMHENNGGRVIAISSIAAQMCQSRNSQGAAAKAGLEALIRVAAREESRKNILVNGISIGLTDTDQAREALDQWGPEATEKIIKSIPLGRMANPEEIADMAVFLASEKGKYITGKIIQVDGGQIISG